MKKHHTFIFKHPKKKIFLFLITAFTVILFISCNEDEEPGTFTAEGYIVGFDPCSTRAPYETGEGLLIVTEQDSILTYNFPEGIFYFPDEIFGNWIISYYFPQEHLNKYKIRFTYRYAEKSEEEYSVCLGIINLGGFMTYSESQVLILHAESI